MMNKYKKNYDIEKDPKKESYDEVSDMLFNMLSKYMPKDIKVQRTQKGDFIFLDASGKQMPDDNVIKEWAEQVVRANPNEFLADNGAFQVDASEIFKKNTNDDDDHVLTNVSPPNTDVISKIALDNAKMILSKEVPAFNKTTKQKYNPYTHTYISEEKNEIPFVEEKKRKTREKTIKDLQLLCERYEPVAKGEFFSKPTMNVSFVKDGKLFFVFKALFIENEKESNEELRVHIIDKKVSIFIRRLSERGNPSPLKEFSLLDKDWEKEIPDIASDTIKIAILGYGLAVAIEENVKDEPTR